MRAEKRLSALILISVLLTACAGSMATLTPKDRVTPKPVPEIPQQEVPQQEVPLQKELVATAEPERASSVPRHPHFEYRGTCGKPCQPIIIRWQLDGAYTAQYGDAPLVSGQFSASKVSQLDALYRELQTLTLGWPRDLTRSSLCASFATDHAQKVFSTPATVSGWSFKDNHGCTGFAKAEELRQLEARIESLLPMENIR
jgi:hypothetical protein